MYRREGKKKRKTRRVLSFTVNNVNDFKLSRTVLLYEDIRLPRHSARRRFFLYLSARSEMRDAEYKRPKKRNVENGMTCTRDVQRDEEYAVPMVKRTCGKNR